MKLSWCVRTRASRAMWMLKLLPSSPVIEAYADRCLSRPAYQKALALEV